MISSPLMTVMVDAVRKAARGLKRDFGEVENLQVSRKGPGNFVSAADRKAEEVLREALMRARPGYGLVLEESGIIEGSDKSHVWHVDPLDGTTNFLHGIPHFAISVAVEDPNGVGGRPEITTAMVYNPITDEGFWAEKGRGAWLQGQRLRVSSRRDLSEALIATGIPFLGHGNFAEWTRIFGAVAPEVAGIRRFGAAALDLAYVAAGRFDGFWESGLKKWDIAAGMLLVREAGGFVTDYRGADRAYEKGEVLASNEQMQTRLHKLVAGALR